MSILPEKLEQYRKFVVFALKYWNSDLVRNASSQLTSPLPEKQSAEELNPKPEELVADLQAMGPTYIKLGQILSTRPDLLPDPYLVALETLQDDAEAIPYEQVREIVEEELGVRISKAFDEFDEEPLACASIGQVHLATLRGGIRVAVKVQRPGVRDQFVKDLDTLAGMTDLAVNYSAKAARYNLDEVVEHMRGILLRELNYEREAQNLLQLKKNLADFPHIKVPSPIPDYCTDRVLTMEYVKGRKITKVSPLRLMETDCAPLAEELVHAYLKQIVTDGFVHADPHPGNVHLTEDDRIVLLDLGMVARLTESRREGLFRLMLALGEGEGERVGRVMADMGRLAKDADVEGFIQMVAQILAESEGSEASDMATGRLLMEMNRLAADFGIFLPVETNVLGKVLLSLEQIVAKLDPHFDLQATIRKRLDELMRSRMAQEFAPGNILETLLQMKKLGESLPERLNKISAALANNEFSVRVDAIDEKRFTDGFQKVANRITIGLIIAATIIGAAMLMRVQTSFTIFGYPGLAMIFFLLAAVAGGILVYHIVFKDEGLKN